MLSTLPAPAYQSQASVTSQQQQQQLPGSLPALLSSVLSTDRAADGRRPAQQTMQAQQAQACQDAQEALEGHGAFIDITILGQGSFGVVAKATDTRRSPPQEVAIKLLPRGDLTRVFQIYIKREILHQSSLRHPFVIAIKQVFLLPRHLAIVMEYAQGGNLFQYILRQGGPSRTPHLQESHARWLFQQLVIGMDYCHRMGVANRDLKLENLLLHRNINQAATAADARRNQRPQLKICDFGYSKHELNSPATSGVGTPIYMAPEIIYGISRYDAKKADMWSIGIILYAMLYGRYPFNNQEADFATKILRAEYPVPPDIGVSPEAAQLLARLLVAEPSQRANMEEVKRHPWFNAQLPDGALTMNDYYIAPVPYLGEIESQVNAIVDAAQSLALRAATDMTVQLPAETASTTVPMRPPHRST